MIWFLIFLTLTILFTKSSECIHQLLGVSYIVKASINLSFHQNWFIFHSARIERMCNKNVSYNGITITKGTLVTVSAFALHYDEEYYPNPNSFNPDRWISGPCLYVSNKLSMVPNYILIKIINERWNPENDERPNTFTYMPFGMGPRNCIGLRFAMEEMKIALCTLVKSLRFLPVAETPVSRTLSLSSFISLPCTNCQQSIVFHWFCLAGGIAVRWWIRNHHPTYRHHNWSRGTFVVSNQ